MPDLTSSPFWEAFGEHSADVQADLGLVAAGLVELEQRATTGTAADKAVAALARLALGRST